MSDIFFEVDVDELSKELKEKTDKIKKDLQDELTMGVANLAKAAWGKSLELARDELGSLSEMYQDNIHFDEISQNFWSITLKSPAMWIEEGRKSGFMEELLSGKSSRTSKEGKKYAVIPFQHNKKPSEQSAKAKELADQIKKSLRSRGINWKKIEYNADGSPRLGRLHSFNFDTARAKPEHKKPLTHGVTVYQSKGTDGNVRRDIMTFRIIHEDHQSEGLWVHPGRQGSKILDKVYDWALLEWEQNILPNIMKDYK